MHVRISTINGATDLTQEFAFWGRRWCLNFSSSEVSEVSLQVPIGPPGSSLSQPVGDRAGHDGERDVAEKVRQEALGVMGGDVTVETFEQVVADIGDPPPAVGCTLRVVRVKVDPARVNENIDFFRSEIVPRMKATPGFRGVRNMIDRASGSGAVGTLWDDEASMNAAEAAAEQRRHEASSRGVEFGGDEP